MFFLKEHGFVPQSYSHDYEYPRVLGASWEVPSDIGSTESIIACFNPRIRHAWDLSQLAELGMTKIGVVDKNRELLQ